MEALLEKEGDVESWNDDRIDELSRRTDEGFKENREGFTRVDQEIKAGFTRVDQEMKAGFEKVATRESVAEVNSRLGQLEVRMDRLYWGIVLLALALLGNSVAQGVWG